MTLPSALTEPVLLLGGFCSVLHEIFFSAMTLLAETSEGRCFMGSLISRRIGAFGIVALCALALNIQVAAQDDEYGPPIRRRPASNRRSASTKSSTTGAKYQGETVRHTFKVYNDGKALLHQQVKPVRLHVQLHAGDSAGRRRRNRVSR